MIQSTIQFISFCIIFLLSTQSFAKSDLPTDHSRVRSLLESMSKVMPEDLNGSWRHMLDKVEIRLRDKLANQECSVYRTIYVNNHGQKNTQQAKKVLDVSRSCLTDEALNMSIADVSDLLRGRLVESLYKTGILYWLDKMTTSRELKKVNRFVYANNYFYTPWTLGVNVKQGAKEALADFWSKVTVAYIKDPNFVKNHPDLYKYLKAGFFKNRTYHPQAELEMGEKLESVTSEDLHPTLAKVRYIAHGNDAWFIRYNMIKNAKTSIYVQYYSLFDDVFGRAYVGLLIEALKRGVKVRIMLDGRGSILSSRGRLMEVLRANGAEAVSYNPLLLGIKNLFKFYKVGLIDSFVASNHDKLMIVDDHKVLTGGRNIGAKYFTNADEYEKRVFQDADIYSEFEKPFISGLVAFHTEFYNENAVNVWRNLLRDYKAVETDCLDALAAMEDRMLNENVSANTMQKYPELNSYKAISSYPNFTMTLSSRYYVVKGLDKTSRLLDHNVITDKIFEFIDAAETEIIIQNPYIVLTKAMREKLINAGKRGVKIVFNTTSPASTDSVLTQAVLVHEWKDVLRDIPGAEIYAVKGPEQLHAKVFVFDDDHVLIGGYNMDYLSEKHNSEFGLLVDSAEFAQDVRESIYAQIENNSLKYDLVNGVGPYSVKEGKKGRRKYMIMYWISKLFGDWI